MNRYLQDIMDQPQTLRAVLEYCIGKGREAMEEAAEVVHSAERVVITSMGSALYSCMPMYHVLSRVHPNVHLVETGDLLVHTPFMEETVYVVMSRSGESGEVASFARKIDEGSGTLIAITMTPESTLARHADHVLRDVATYDGLICTKAFTSMILVGLLLGSELDGTLDGELVEHLRGHFAWMEAEKEGMLRQISSMTALDGV